MSERSKTFLVTKKDRKVVEADLLDGLSREEIEATQAAWQQVFQTVSVPPQHSHWNWNDKYQLVAAASLAYRMFGLEVDHEMQGLMLVLTTGRFSKIEAQRGKPLIYVDYLATAPWNSIEVVNEPRFSGVGKVFIKIACQLSEEEGFRGRIGLHSLPQAEKWYEHVCQMTNLGKDRSYQNLSYLEMTPEQAARFIKG